MRMTPEQEKPKRDYSVFGDDIETTGVDFALLKRLFSWMKPYRTQGFIAIGLVLLSASAAVLAPVVISRVVVDGILLPESGTTAPDFGQKALNGFLASSLSLHPLITACMLFAVWTVLWAVFSHGFRIMLARASTSASPWAG